MLLKKYPYLLTIVIASLFLTFSSCISEHEENHYIEKELQIGEQLPQFTVTMNNGKKLSTNDLKGQCSVIAFFHTRCPDCQKELPILQRLQEECQLPFRLICISREETAPSILQYWQEHHLTLPFSAQSDRYVFELFAGSRIPRIYVSNAQLQIEAIFTDNPIASYEQLVAAVRKANPRY